MAVLLAVGSSAGGCVPLADAQTLPAEEHPTAQEEEHRLFGVSLDRWEQNTIRLQTISQRIRIAGRPLCRDALAPILGVAVLDTTRLPYSLLDIAHSRYGVGRGLVVLSMLAEIGEGGAALQPGDVLAAIGGKSVESIADLGRRLDSPVRVDFKREAERLRIELPVPHGCGFPAELIEDEKVNAFADFRDMEFTRAMLRELEDDMLLAIVVGHELAHSIFDRRRPRFRGSNRPREARADHVGIYLAAMAGYPIAATPDLWITLKSNVNLVDSRSRTHPTSAARFAALRKTIDEIQARQAAGLPLLPESQ
jgi:hypothetical protein